MKSKLLLLPILLSIIFSSCHREKETNFSFKSRLIADNAKYWWAVAIGDISGDSIADVVFIDNNSSGGKLAFKTGQKEKGTWQETIIAAEAPSGGDFASGDLELGDIDGDGDLDVLGVKHTGEWDDAGAPAQLFWYENPKWQPHPIGEVPDAVKDLSLADFNKDGRIDLAVLTYDEHTLTIFRNVAHGIFALVKTIKIPNLHEGMDVGDTDGDGYIDIVANGYCFINPGKDISKNWRIETIDSKWHSQTGDWSQNATKNFCADLNNDEKSEVFISHSERNGYPVSWYERNENGWAEHVITDSLSSCHTLQVFDFDLDGDLDVLAGVNADRAANIGKEKFPVIIFLNDGTNLNWEPWEITDEGIYNGRVADFDADGDFDIFRLPGHEATDYYLLENELK